MPTNQPLKAVPETVVNAFSSLPKVWLNPTGTGRYQRAYFKRIINLDSSPVTAYLHLFADTRYQLRINGTVISAGPARFYPEYPEFDSYDLSALLHAGENVIAVEVYHGGLATFHTLLVRAAFVATGEITKSDGSRISLSAPDGWLCAEASGYDRTTPKFSFATGPIQIFDERKAIPNWDGSKADAQIWKQPVPLAVQSGWGTFQPRTIPYLTQQELLPKKLLSAHKHIEDETIHSFRFTDFSEPSRHVYPRKIVLAGTYIYSPIAQKVTSTVYWGEHYLNGKLLEKSGESRLAGQEAVLDLNEGWNLLVISYGIWTPTWDFHIALPKSAQLSLSPNKKLKDTAEFCLSSVFAVSSEFILGLKLEEWTTLKDIPGGWSPAAIPEAPVLPAKNMAWAKFGDDIALPPHSTGSLKIEAHDSTSFIFDFGNEVLGRIFVDFDAPSATHVEVGYAEDLKNGRPWFYKNVQVNAGERHVAKGGKSRLETFMPRGFRYLQVTVYKHSESVTISKVGVISQRYPHRKQGWFRCSDPLFDDIWESGWRTLLVCSEDVYTDCPWRERTLYGGDLLAEFATALITSGDTALARRSLRMFIQSQSEDTRWQQSMAPMDRSREPLFDYPLLNLIACEWHYRLTGDKRFGEETLTTYSSLMERCLEQRLPNGLYSSFARPFIDHVGIERGGLSCPLNALISKAWFSYADLADTFGQPEKAKEARAHGLAAREAVRRAFWDSSVGAYIDGIEDDGKPTGNHSPIASFWCLFFDVATDEQIPAIMRHFENRWQMLDQEIEHFGTPYSGFFMLGALYGAGIRGNTDATAFAERFIRRQWGHMLYQGSDTIWEHFHPMASLAHAWSTAPNYYLSTRALGVRLGLPDEPLSNGTLRICPQSELLTWAQGAVPTAKGLVEVSWEIRGGCFFIDVNAAGYDSISIEPVGKLAKLPMRATFNNRPISK